MHRKDRNCDEAVGGREGKGREQDSHILELFLQKNVKNHKFKKNKIKKALLVG